MRPYHSKVALTSRCGYHVRFVPGALAGALVDNGTARPVTSSGRIREVELNRSAATHAERTGPATMNGIPATRFTRRTRLEDSAALIYEHHPRALDYE